MSERYYDTYDVDDIENSTIIENTAKTENTAEIIAVFKYRNCLNDLRKLKEEDEEEALVKKKEKILVDLEQNELKNLLIRERNNLSQNYAKAEKLRSIQEKKRAELKERADIYANRQQYKNRHDTCVAITVSIGIVVIIALCWIFFFFDVDCSGCVESEPKHEHTFSYHWEYNATEHWHKATCEHSEIKGSREEHIDKNDDWYCDVCSYKRSYTVYVSRYGKIHRKKNCSGMEYYTAMPYDQAIEKGYVKCKNCY